MRPPARPTSITLTDRGIDTGSVDIANFDDTSEGTFTPDGGGATVDFGPSETDQLSDILALGQPGSVSVTAGPGHGCHLCHQRRGRQFRHLRKSPASTTLPRACSRPTMAIRPSFLARAEANQFSDILALGEPGQVQITAGDEERQRGRDLV